MGAPGAGRVDAHAGAGPTSVVVDVVGMGAAAAADVFRVCCTAAGYTVVASGPNTFRAARVSRPTWATVAACCTAVVGGLGLLFLLVKRTSVVDAVFVNDRTGVKMHAHGGLTPTLAAQLRSALTNPAGGSGLPAPGVGDPRAWAPRAAPAAVLPSPPASPALMSPASMTSGPMSSLDAPGLGAASFQPAAAASRLLAPDGSCVDVGNGVVIGRAPLANPTLPAAVLCACDDLSLSKTHATFSPAPDGVWVVDHHSTNGTKIVVDGTATLCPPDVRVRAPFGAQIVVGELSLSVVRS